MANLPLKPVFFLWHQGVSLTLSFLLFGFHDLGVISPHCDHIWGWVRDEGGGREKGGDALRCGAL